MGFTGMHWFSLTVVLTVFLVSPLYFTIWLQCSKLNLRREMRILLICDNGFVLLAWRPTFLHVDVKGPYR